MSEDPASILLVDDKRANLVALSALLEPLGHPLVCASSGEEALARLAERDFALILMDVRMPGLDGFETVLRVRENPAWRHIPVVFITAIRDDVEYEARGYALGAIDYVAKPLDSEVLVSKLRAFMAWHQRGEELRAQATRDERDRVLGIVSHDLRSPLTAICTSTDVLLAGIDERHAKVVRRIKTNAIRMTRLINDLSDYTRGQNGLLTIHPGPSSLANIVMESVEEIQAEHRRSVELSVGTSRPAVVDADRVAQIVSNLVANAVKHSPSDSRIVVTLGEREGEFELRVWNEGAIDEVDRLGVFEAFRKGGSSSGLGLGLYISRLIARAHGGDITLSSSDGAGTTFLLTLPFEAPN